MFAVTVESSRERARCACLGLFTAALLVVAPARARAAEMAWPLERPSEALLGFGAAYPSGDGEATHRGIDLASPEGSAVLAPCSGTVSFVGSVPGVGGGTVVAATIDSGTGLSVTLLPLSDACVRRGDSLEAGSPVGELAAGGDGSSAASHLHVGVRRQDVYLDPSALLGAPAAGSGSMPDPEVSATVPATGETAAASPESGITAHTSGVGTGALTSPLTAVTPSEAGVPVDVGVGVALERETGQSFVNGAADVRSANEAARPSVLASRRGVAARQAPQAGGRSATLAGVVTTVARVARKMSMIWRAALLATLVGLAALWPIWRRRESEEQPEVSAAPGGNDVAAVAGRC